MAYREKRSDGTVRLTGGALQAYPVGAVYFSATLVDPAALFGGTWARMGQGKMIVGVDETDTQFDTPLETGGSKTHLIESNNLPPHEHGAGTLVTNTGTAHTHGAGSLTVSLRGAAGSAAGAAMGNTNVVSNAQVQGDTGSTGSGHTHVISGNTGTGVGLTKDPVNHQNPFITLYMWRRTA